jgi:hypothetical protein
VLVLILPFVWVKQRPALYRRGFGVL